MDLPARSFDLARPGVAPPLVWEPLSDAAICLSVRPSHACGADALLLGMWVLWLLRSVLETACWESNPPASVRGPLIIGSMAERP